MSFHAVCLKVMCFAALIPAVALAAPLPEESKTFSEPPAEKLRKALKQPVTLDIVDQPLEAAIKQLKEHAKVNLVLDHSAGAGAAEALMVPPGGPIAVPPGFAVPGAGVPAQNVTLKVKDMKLRDVLKTILSGHNLTFAIVGDTLLVATEDVIIQRQLRQPVSMDLDAVPLSKALQQLARETGANLILDPKLKKEADTAVSLQLDDVPLDTAVRLLCESAGLKPVRLGNVVYVTGKASANELRADPDLAPQTAPQVGAYEAIAGGLLGRAGLQFNLATPATVPVPPPPAVEQLEVEKKPSPPKDEKKGSGDPDK